MTTGSDDQEDITASGRSVHVLREDASECACSVCVHVCALSVTSGPSILTIYVFIAAFPTSREEWHQTVQRSVDRAKDVLGGANRRHRVLIPVLSSYHERLCCFISNLQVDIYSRLPHEKTSDANSEAAL